MKKSFRGEDDAPKALFPVSANRRIGPARSLLQAGGAFFDSLFHLADIPFFRLTQHMGC
jgi:hypothetical protein